MDIASAAVSKLNSTPNFTVVKYVKVMADEYVNKYLGGDVSEIPRVWLSIMRHIPMMCINLECHEFLKYCVSWDLVDGVKFYFENSTREETDTDVIRKMVIALRQGDIKAMVEVLVQHFSRTSTDLSETSTNLSETSTNLSETSTDLSETSTDLSETSTDLYDLLVYALQLSNINVFEELFKYFNPPKNLHVFVMRDLMLNSSYSDQLRSVQYLMEVHGGEDPWSDEKFGSEEYMTSCQDTFHYLETRGAPNIKLILNGVDMDNILNDAV